MNIQISNIYDNRKAETTQCPSKDEKINKIWHIHTIEHYLAIKKE